MSSIVGGEAIILYTSKKKKMTSPKSGRENSFLHKSNENISKKKKKVRNNLFRCLKINQRIVAIRGVFV